MSADNAITIQPGKTEPENVGTCVRSGVDIDDQELPIFSVLSFADEQLTSPGQMTDCPPGLEYIGLLDKIHCKRVPDVLHDVELANRFRIMNGDNQQAFWALEDSSTSCRILALATRGFALHITDMNQEQEFMCIERPYRSCVGCNWCADGCCKWPLYVTDSKGQLLGVVRMMQSCWDHRFGVFNKEEQLLYELTGSRMATNFGNRADRIFKITDVYDGSVIGNIDEIDRGQAHTLALTFPLHLNVKRKILLLAGLFCIEYCVYEVRHELERRGG